MSLRPATLKYGNPAILVTPSVAILLWIPQCAYTDLHRPSPPALTLCREEVAVGTLAAATESGERRPPLLSSHLSKMGMGWPSSSPRYQTSEKKMPKRTTTSFQRTTAAARTSSSTSSARAQPFPHRRHSAAWTSPRLR